MNQSATITATRVASHQRMAFLPRMFDAVHLRGEALVYGFARRMCPHYQGAYWAFQQLDNGAGYMVPVGPEFDGQFYVTGLNGSRVLVSADAFGIVVMMHALSHLSFKTHGVTRTRLVQRFEGLRDYAWAHAEARQILELCD